MKELEINRLIGLTTSLIFTVFKHIDLIGRHKKTSILITYELFGLSQSLLQPVTVAGVEGFHGLLGEGEEVGAVLPGRASLAGAEVDKLQPPV